MSDFDEFIYKVMRLFFIFGIVFMIIMFLREWLL